MHDTLLILPRVVLFDMDGTLTAPFFDYAAIKAEIGLGPGPLLESMATLDESRRKQAEVILHRHERIAAEQSTLNPGCRELLAWLAAERIPMALITRNTRLSVTTVMALHELKMDVLITREDGPFKPNPAPLALACQRLGARPEHAWMVGDSQYDVEAAIAAEIRAVWLSHGRPKSFTAKPWLTVTDLPELAGIMKKASRV